MQTFYLTLAALVVGIGIFHVAMMYLGLIDMGINAAIDTEYRQVGIEPTGDRRESEEFARRAQAYKDLKNGTISEVEMKTKYREYKEKRDAARGEEP